LLAEFKASERQVCELMAVPRSSGRYRSRRDDSQLQERLRELAREHPRFGYRRLHLYLHEERGVNHKKVQRVYRELGLTVKRTRRKHLRRTLQPRPVLTAPNQEWALDFASDVTAAGQRIRVLGVLDSFTRQCLALEVATSFPSRRVTRVLERAIAAYGKPQSIRSDNGPELTSRHYLAWAMRSPAANMASGVLWVGAVGNGAGAVLTGGATLFARYFEGAAAQPPNQLSMWY
jgi:putative transposase